MSAGHTPLPWSAKIWRHSGHADTVCIKDADGHEIISWTGFDGVRCTKAEIRANARLVARAVNSHHVLLEAVERARRHAMNIGITDGSCLAQLDAAIAKATGASS